MRYIQLEVKVKRERAEDVQAALIDAGFESMLIDDSSVARDILENPDLYKYDYLGEEIEDFAGRESDEITITLYFGDDDEGRTELERCGEILERLTADGTCPDLSFESSVTGDDSEWLYKWQENFRPTKVGSLIVVKPGWEEYEAGPGELVIEMEPGMAFGSGLHETTSMCIKALEKYMKPGMKVLDVGTGTGILAMAAALLGAEDALGVDIDDEAVRVGTENVKRNGLTDTITIAKGDLVKGVDYDADVLVANLMADLVIRLAPAAAGHLDTGGLFISSGILDIKADAVAQAVRDAGFEIAEISEDGEWRAITAVKRDCVKNFFGT